MYILNLIRYFLYFIDPQDCVAIMCYYSYCFFLFRASVHHSISQMKHQLDATLSRFYFCRVTLHVSGASAHHQEYLKLVQRPLVHVLSLQVSHHISLLVQRPLVHVLSLQVSHHISLLGPAIQKILN